MSTPVAGTASVRLPRELLDDEAALRAVIGSTVLRAIARMLGPDFEPISVQTMLMTESAHVVLVADAAPPKVAYGVLATLPRRGSVLLSRHPLPEFARTVDLVVKVRRR